MLVRINLLLISLLLFGVVLIFWVGLQLGHLKKQTLGLICGAGHNCNKEQMRFHHHGKKGSVSFRGMFSEGATLRWNPPLPTPKLLILPGWALMVFLRCHCDLHHLDPLRHATLSAGEGPGGGGHRGRRRRPRGPGQVRYAIGGWAGAGAALGWHPPKIRL